MLSRQRLKQLLAEYGKLALFIYLGIFAVVLAGFALTIQLGFRVESTAGTAGVWGAAYLATKVAQPLRILATLALTPLVARLLRRPRASHEPRPDQPGASSPAEHRPESPS
jgi:hypothetical protein